MVFAWFGFCRMPVSPGAGLAWRGFRRSPGWVGLASFRRIPYSCRSISTAPVRGGTHFLCCCKESKQRKQLLIRPRSHAIWVVLSSIVGCLKSALKHLIGLGSRTVRRPKTLRTLVQHERASAQRYALPPGMQGKPTCGTCGEMETLVEQQMHHRLTGRPRSGLELFGAEPACCVVRCARPCAIQARLGL